MVKLFYSVLAITFFAGCSQQVQCPKIETLKQVDQLEINKKNTCVCGNDLKLLLNHDRQLRKSEVYYKNEITKYNEEFTK